MKIKIILPQSQFCKFIHSYRIQNAMQNYISQNINLQKKSLIQKDIIYAIDIHRKAMKLVSIPEYIYSTRNNVFLFLKILGLFNI